MGHCDYSGDWTVAECSSDKDVAISGSGGTEGGGGARRVLRPPLGLLEGSEAKAFTSVVCGGGAAISMSGNVFLTQREAFVPSADRRPGKRLALAGSRLNASDIAFNGTDRRCCRRDASTPPERHAGSR